MEGELTGVFTRLCGRAPPHLSLRTRTGLQCGTRMQDVGVMCDGAVPGAEQRAFATGTAGSKVRRGTGHGHKCSAPSVHVLKLR